VLRRTVVDDVEGVSLADPVLATKRSSGSAARPVASALGIHAADLDPSLPLRVVDTGANHLMPAVTH